MISQIAAPVSLHTPLLVPTRTLKWIQRVVRCLILGLVLSACNRQHVDPEQASGSPPPKAERHRVAGQVFIVTADSRNVPLALADISLYRLDTLDEFFSSKSGSSEDIRRQLGKRFQQVQSALEQTKADEPKAVEELEAQQDRLTRMYDPHAPLPSANSQSSTTMYKHRIAHMTSVRDAFRDDYASWPTSKFYFANMPPPLLRTKSDATGSFTFDVAKEGVYAVCAHAERDISEPNPPEEYYWMIKHRVSASEDQQILLANDNSTTSGSPDSLISCKGNALKHPLGEGVDADIGIYLPDLPLKTYHIVGSDKVEVEHLLSNWTSRVSENTTSTNPSYCYFKDVQLTVTFSRGKATLVTVISDSAISDHRLEELKSLVGGGDPKESDIMRNDAGIYGFSVGELTDR